jgi:hypothetical protein
MLAEEENHSLLPGPSPKGGGAMSETTFPRLLIALIEAAWEKGLEPAEVSGELTPSGMPLGDHRVEEPQEEESDVSI